MEAPAPGRTIDVLVYLRESGPDACPIPVGYEATVTVGIEGLEAVTFRPVTDPAHGWDVLPGTALWRVVRAFLMVLPALRGRAAMHQPVKEVA